MWTREKFKSNAKLFLKMHIKNAIIVCLIFSVFNIIFNSSNEYIPLDNNKSNIISEDTYSSFSKDYKMNQLRLLDKNVPTNKFSLNYGFPTIQNGFRIFRNVSINALSTITILSLAIISLIGRIFILNPLSIGKVRYFIKTFENPENDNIKLLFSPFKEDFFSTSLKLLTRDIYLFLWTLLFIIPGIVKYYQYFFVNYILSDDPSLTINEAIEISKEMTKNDKLNIFVFELSFIGWQILSSLLLGLGYLILNPYVDATYANFYLYKRSELSKNSESEYEFHEN